MAAEVSRAMPSRFRCCNRHHPTLLHLLLEASICRKKLGGQRSFKSHSYYSQIIYSRKGTAPVKVEACLSFASAPTPKIDPGTNIPRSVVLFLFDLPPQASKAYQYATTQAKSIYIHVVPSLIAQVDFVVDPFVESGAKTTNYHSPNEGQGNTFYLSL